MKVVNNKRQWSKTIHIPTRRALATIQSPLGGGISYIIIQLRPTKVYEAYGV